MGSKSDAFEDLTLQHTFNSDWAAPGIISVGLWTQALTDASTGSSAGEVSGGGYARVGLARGTANWTVPSGGTCKNNVVVNFGTASADWGTVTHFAALNAATAGTILYWGQLTAQKIILNGDSASFAANSLVFTED